MVENNIKIGDIIAKTGSTFRIIDIKGIHYFAEQRIGNNICAYEVGTFYINNIIKNNVKTNYYTLPPVSKFGKGIYDKSFPIRKKEEALAFFNSIEL